jgi:hypothetical protein
MEDNLDKRSDARQSLQHLFALMFGCVLRPWYLQAIQQEMEDGLDKKGDAKDFEEKLAEQLFADEGDGEKIQVGGQHIPSAHILQPVCRQYLFPLSCGQPWCNEVLGMRDTGAGTCLQMGGDKMDIGQESGASAVCSHAYSALLAATALTCSLLASPCVIT